MWKFGYGANMTCKCKQCAYNVVKKNVNMKSAHAITLVMRWRHHTNDTICACHVMKLLIPGTIYNSPHWQGYVKIKRPQTHETIKHAVCWKHAWQNRNWTHHANWHELVLLYGPRSILLCLCSTLLHSFSHTLWGVSFLVELQQAICAQKPISAWKSSIILARDPKQSWRPGG